MFEEFLRSLRKPKNKIEYTTDDSHFDELMTSFEITLLRSGHVSSFKDVDQNTILYFNVDELHTDKDFQRAFLKWVKHECVDIEKRHSNES